MSMGSNPVFPNIVCTYKFVNLLNLLNISKLKKNLIFYIPFTLKTFQFLRFFKSSSFVHKYQLIKKNNKTFIKIYIYFYNTSHVCSFSRVVSKPSKKVYISYKSLRLLNKKSGSSLFIISTTKGLLTNIEAANSKTGGIIIGFFSI